ncbi:guanine nucleotide-binding protein G(f) subunit alpha-like [Hyposmocoma kahamanoa]|uniref:guanine nucleotide-binding protein G(f) subunit alpha-like n=1 Tax=Hyposmocoma kahamanoa TaxID=1477025 RepID=UPI000E6D60DE|nr:guanine nucleotide-binding protein G(f) subunit alpha-like [Hyposmocoma kahamanoa]
MGFIPCMKAYDEDEDNSKQIDREIKQWFKVYDQAIKLLLLGTGESGKTTIIKQMKILHIQGFSASERQEKIQYIRHNIHESIYDIVRHMSTLSIGLQNIKNVQAQQIILRCGPNGPPEYNEAYFDHVRNLWRDSGVRECFKRSNEYQLIDSAEYFLDRIDLIEKPDYMPSDADILRCRQKTTGIQKIEFKVKLPKSMQGGVQDFWMFDVGGQRGERKKWIQVFEGINAIWFLVACSDFDQTLREDNSQNRLKEALVLFEDVWQSRYLQINKLSSTFLIFMNQIKFILKQIQQGQSIGRYFPAYEGYRASGDEYNRTRLFIRSMFMEITNKKSERRNLKASTDNFVVGEATKVRECYYHFTTATDTDNVRTVFKDVHQMILTKILQLDIQALILRVVVGSLLVPPKLLQECQQPLEFAEDFV